MTDEPKKFKETAMIGDVKMTLIGGAYSSMPILDTEVIIEAGQVCWITWEDREKFTRELNAVIEKYRI